MWPETLCHLVSLSPDVTQSCLSGCRELGRGCLPQSTALAEQEAKNLACPKRMGKKTLGNKKKQNGEAEGSACGRLGKAGDKSERLGVPVSNPRAVGCGLGGWSASETNGNRPLEQSCYYIRRIKVPVVGAENEYSYCVFGRRSLARSQPQ